MESFGATMHVLAVRGYGSEGVKITGVGGEQDYLYITSWNTSRKMSLIANTRAKIGLLVSQGSA